MTGNGLSGAAAESQGSRRKQKHSPSRVLNLLDLPNDVLEEILLKQEARSEAVSKMVCSQLCRLTRTPWYTSLLEKVVDQQDYCPVIMPSRFSDRNPLGWDPVARKWRTLPSLSFLPEKEGRKLGMWCNKSDGGLLLLTVKSEVRSRWQDRDTDTRYVCNPLTRSYVAIDPALVLPKGGLYHEFLLRAGKCSPKFTLFATRAKQLYAGDPEEDYIITLYRLESSNMGAGWVPLHPASPEHLVRRAHVVAGPLLVDGVIYFLRQHEPTHIVVPQRYHDVQARVILLTRYHIDEGIWKEQNVSTILTSDCFAGNLVDVGGQLWVVQTVVYEYGTDQPDTYPLVIEEKKKLLCKFSMYDRQEEQLSCIHEDIIDYAPFSYTPHVIFDDFKYPRYHAEIVVQGNFKSTILFQTRDGGGGRLFDVLTRTWSECPKPDVDVSDFRRLQGSLHLSHVSLRP